MGMKLEFNVPTSLKDISLGDYQRFIKIASDKDIKDIFIRKKMVQIFCHIPLLAVEKIDRKSFTVISNKIITVLSEKPKLTHITEIEGNDFGFIPNLDDDLTIGEFADLDDYMNDWQKFHKAMAVLYRPIKSRKKTNYIIEDYQGNEKYSDLMLKMNMEVVMGAVVFFWTLSKQLLIITPKFLTQQLRKNPKAAAALEKSGHGISTYTNLLEEACSNLMRLHPSI